MLIFYFLIHFHGLIWHELCPVEVRGIIQNKHNDTGENMINNWKLAITALGILIGALPGLGSATVLTFSNGYGGAGYQGAQDTELEQAHPTHNHGSSSNLTIDGDDHSGDLDDTNALLKFDNIFGTGPGQIPFGSTINSARLELNIHSRGDDLNMLMMLVGWDESSATWDSLGNGIQADNSEAEFLRLLTGLNDSSKVWDGATYTIDVTSDLQLWSNGKSNYGWGFTPTGNNGVDFHTSNHSNDDHSRPTLVVNVPEPASIVLMGLGLLGMGFSCKKA